MSGSPTHHCMQTAGSIPTLAFVPFVFVSPADVIRFNPSAYP